MIALSIAWIIVIFDGRFAAQCEHLPPHLQLIDPRQAPTCDTIGVVATSVTHREVLMANKDKGGRSTKKVAGKSLKEAPREASEARFSQQHWQQIDRDDVRPLGL